ncbi:MAG: hypothetical protein HYT09_04335 [Candidatus Levybacteria bacterium]|nr:hypothetical protein [Candidatus Levybacteria bacterium]
MGIIDKFFQKIRNKAEDLRDEAQEKQSGAKGGIQRLKEKWEEEDAESRIQSGRNRMEEELNDLT